MISASDISRFFFFWIMSDIFSLVIQFVFLLMVFDLVKGVFL